MVTVAHIVYAEDSKSLMERYVEAAKDRLECLDDCFPCRRLEECDGGHIHNWLSVFTVVYNNIRRPVRFYVPGLEDKELNNLQKTIQRSLT